MKKFLVLTLMVVVIAGAFNVVVAANKKAVIGEWKYEVASAPYGYETGTLVFTEKEGKLSGHVKFADGYKMDLKNITFNNNQLKCGVYIDYEYISIKAKVEGNKLQGTADTPEGELKLTAQKKK